MIVGDKKSRRQFLVGTGGVLVAIPFLPSAGEALGQTSNTAIRRFLSVLTCDGYYGAHFWPQLPGSAFTALSTTVKQAALPSVISPILDSKFTSLRDKIMLFRGHHYLCGQTPGGETGHGNRPFLTAQGGDPSGDNFRGTPDYTPSGKAYDSIDHYIAAKVYQGMTPQVAIVNACISWDTGAASYSFKAKDDGVNWVNPPAYTSVDALWSLLFASLSGSPDEQARLQAARVGVADLLLASYKGFLASPRFSTEDKNALTQHVAALDDLEKKVKAVRTNTCTVPAQTSVPYGDGSAAACAAYRDAARAMVDLIVMAFQCDVTRVANFKLHPDTLFRSIAPYNTGHHDASHGGDLASINVQKGIFTELFGHVAYMIEQLDAAGLMPGLVGMVGNEIGNLSSNTDGTPDAPDADPNHLGVDTMGFFFGDSTLLNTGKYVVTEVGDSANGRWHRKVGRAWNEVLISVMDLYGLQPTDWEKPGFTGFGTYNSDANYAHADAAVVSPAGIRGKPLLGFKK